jgi:hypothetical protein
MALPAIRAISNPLDLVIDHPRAPRLYRRFDASSSDQLRRAQILGAHQNLHRQVPEQTRGRELSGKNDDELGPGAWAIVKLTDSARRFAAIVAPPTLIRATQTPFICRVGGIALVALPSAPHSPEGSEEGQWTSLPTKSCVR